jgi:hypothetical protein
LNDPGFVFETPTLTTGVKDKQPSSRKPNKILAKKTDANSEEKENAKKRNVSLTSKFYFTFLR